MKTEEILAKLNGMAATGAECWSARCPAHDDRNASLSIKHDGDKTLIYCHAGCSTDEVCQALGITLADLYDTSKHGVGSAGAERYGLTLEEYSASKRLGLQFLQSLGCRNEKYPDRARPDCVAIPYYDEKGAQIALRARMLINQGEHKGSKFKWFPKQGEMHLYGLWRQPADKNYLIVVEGESDCHSLWQGGWPAMGLPGANTMLRKPDKLAPLLQYRTLYFSVEDDDGGMHLLDFLHSEPGAPFAQRAWLFTIPKPTKDPSGLWAECKDIEEYQTKVRDLLETAVPLDQYQEGEGIKAAREKHEKKGAQPAAPASRPAGEPGRPQADYYAMAEDYRQTLMADGQLQVRYYRGGWYEYWDHHFGYLPDAIMRGRLQAYIQDNGEEYHVKPGVKAATELLANLQSTKFCAFHREPEIPFWVGDGSSAKGWMPFRNKIVNLEMAAHARMAELSGEGDIPASSEYIRDNTAELFASYALPYDFDPSAECPIFDAFLESVMPTPDDRQMLLMLLGLMLVPETRYNVFFYLFGPPGCGKSTFLSVIRMVVGDPNTCSLRLEQFDDKFSLWPLTERLVNIVGDQQTNDPFGKIFYIMDGIFKDTVSGGVIQVERKHQDVQAAPVIARHIFASNALPNFSGAAEAIWDRLRAIPFEQRFRDTEAEDKYIIDKMQKELPGILNRALEGLAMLRRLKRFPESKAARAAKDQHRLTCDPDQSWILDNFELKQGAYTQCEEAYKAYSNYMFEHGYRRRTVATFNQHILRAFNRRPVRKRTITGNIYVFDDLAPKSDSKPPDEVF